MPTGLFSGVSFFVAYIFQKLSELCFLLDELFIIVEELGGSLLFLQIVFTLCVVYRICAFVFFFAS